MKKTAHILGFVFFTTIILAFSTHVRCQDNHLFLQEDIVIHNDSINLKACLIIPETVQKPDVILMIAGSGPTDMDGNNIMMTNNSLKFLAQELAGQGIASLRYNKRSIPSNGNSINESELVFEDFVGDAMKCYETLKDDERFGDVFILGHSQGSLIGILVAEKARVSGFISLAGTGEPIGDVLIRQISEQSPLLGKQAEVIVDSLKEGFSVSQVNPMLSSVFRPSVQPFIRSWNKYNPAVEISRLSIRVLIIQGTTDIQVGRQDALDLSKGDPDAEMEFIEGMNHILKKAPADRVQNIGTYTNPNLPVMPELINIISRFIKQD